MQAILAEICLIRAVMIEWLIEHFPQHSNTIKLCSPTADYRFDIYIFKDWDMTVFFWWTKNLHCVGKNDGFNVIVTSIATASSFSRCQVSPLGNRRSSFVSSLTPQNEFLIMCILLSVRMACDSPQSRCGIPFLSALAHLWPYHLCLGKQG